jgi:hypothetical protein
MALPADAKNGFTYKYDKIEDARIPDGRWKDLIAEKNDIYEDLKAGYGYMRAPW